MRSRILAGLLALLPALPALGQVKGEVESIGFGRCYRPNCWTPMVVRLTATTDKDQFYQLQVVQEDLDSDKVIYTRTVVLEGSRDGQPARESRFWMYFVPQPTRGGLPDASSGAAGRKELQAALKVYLCTPAGRQLASLPYADTLINLDPFRDKTGIAPPRRGCKLILAITDGSSQVMWTDYARSVGITEDIAVVNLPVRALPENVLGYESVDAILWLNGEPQDLDADTGQRRRALVQFVRHGGKLVISQTPQWQKNADPVHGFQDLLPVTLRGMQDRNDLEPLIRLAEPRHGFQEFNFAAWRRRWEQLRGPWKVAYAQPRPGALVEQWMQWRRGDYRNEAGEPADPPQPLTPYLARMSYGLGSVAWVAQDLGDRNLTAGQQSGWPRIFDRLFDWNHGTIVRPNRPTDQEQAVLDTYTIAAGNDLGASLLYGMEHTATGAMLIVVAVLFFIAYWLVAGPGSYLFLLQRKKAALSWFLFAASALAATLLTVLIVQLIVRGPPKIKQVTVVQAWSAPGATGLPALVHANIGLYIPRDGLQRVELTEAGPGSYLAPFPMHPAHLGGENEYPAYLEYRVPIRDSAAENEPVAVEFPYRSTLKKVKAFWSGSIPGGIEGTPRHLEAHRGYLEGRLTNGTGQDLADVYLAYRHRESPEGRSATDGDWIIYVPAWAKGATLNLADLMDLRKDVRRPDRSNNVLPGQGKVLAGRLGTAAGELDWDGVLFSQLDRGHHIDKDFDDSDRGQRFAHVMLSLFERLPPSRDSGKGRFELLRRGARRLDVSGAVGAGAMVVLARAAGSQSPLPLAVGGGKIAGEGTVLYQFVLPMDRSAVSRPPATLPAR